MHAATRVTFASVTQLFLITYTVTELFAAIVRAHESGLCQTESKVRDRIVRVAVLL